MSVMNLLKYVDGAKPVQIRKVTDESECESRSKEKSKTYEERKKDHSKIR